MITVIHLRDSPFVGGPEKQILGQCARLDRSRFEPVIASFTSSGSNALLEAAREAGIRTEALADGKLTMPNAVRRLSAILRRSERPVVVSSGFKADLTAWFACARERVPWIAWFHGFTASTARVRLYEALDMIAAKRADATIAVCDRAAKQLQARGFPNVKAIPNAVDAAFIASLGSRETARRELGIGESEPIVGVVSRLSIEKGIDYFIDSAPLILRSHPDTRFLVIGDGPMMPALRRRAGRLAVAHRFVFTGMREDAVSLMKAMDVFVLPSLRENLPVALLEAMACGISVVATDVGGVAEVLETTLADPIVPGSARAISDAVTTLLDDPALRAEHSAVLVRRAERFSSIGT